MIEPVVQQHARRTRLIAAASAVAVAGALVTASPPSASAKTPKASGSTARGTGGAVSSVDVNASRIGRDVLAKGGNAADAAVAMAS
ncbi:MAG: hypothetical protein ABWY58_01910, partial [Aeromicrobium sp.]